MQEEPIKLVVTFFHDINIQDGEDEKHKIDFDVSDHFILVFTSSLQEAQT